MIHWLRFRMEYLGATDAGEKPYTFRVWRPGFTAWHVGDGLVLAFGAYHRATLRHAKLSALDHLWERRGVLYGTQAAKTRMLAAAFDLDEIVAEMLADWVKQYAVLWWEHVHSPSEHCCAIRAGT